MERLRQQMEFILEVDKLKNITRQTWLSSGERKENDSEHSWHLALMCALLAEYANEQIDVLRTMQPEMLRKESGRFRRQTAFFICCPLIRQST